LAAELRSFSWPENLYFPIFTVEAGLNRKQPFADSAYCLDDDLGLVAAYML